MSPPESFTMGSFLSELAEATIPNQLKPERYSTFDDQHDLTVPIIFKTRSRAALNKDQSQQVDTQTKPLVLLIASLAAGPEAPTVLPQEPAPDLAQETSNKVLSRGDESFNNADAIYAPAETS
ncbi:MAG: hypothetical protein AAGM22_16850 [Acidobacteriota bacterium]